MQHAEYILDIDAIEYDDSYTYKSIEHKKSPIERFEIFEMRKCVKTFENKSIRKTTKYFKCKYAMQKYTCKRQSTSECNVCNKIILF